MLARFLALSGACLLGLVACAAPPAAPPMQQAAAPVAPPPPPPPVRIRGTIASLDGNVLTINTREGTKVPVTTADPLAVSIVKRVQLTAIKDNTYVGIASRPGPNNSREALEVLVFPEAMRGAGEGDYPWDLQPGSMMTNAPVTGVVKARSGRELTLTYKTGTVTIHVPWKAPVVTFAPGTRADLRRGAKVFVIAHKDATGNLAAPRVTVGKNGVNPPM